MSEPFAQRWRRERAARKRAEALLESKALPDGGWPAERKYYKTSTEISLGNDNVDWGPSGKTRMNPWVTVDALHVLRAAGRFSP